MKQTALDWLLEQMSKEGMLPKLEDYHKAKQMEKQEIKDAFHDGRTWNNSWNEETYFVEVYEKNGRYL